MNNPENISSNEKYAKEVMTDFFISYLEKNSNTSDEDWLKNKISEHLPEMPKNEVENFCDELFFCLKDFDETTEDILSNHNSNYRSEIWMYKKLLKNFSEENEEHFQNLCCKNEILFDINNWLAEVSDDLKKIKFERDKLHYDDEDFEEFDNDFWSYRNFSSGTENISRKKFLTKESVGNSLNKSIFNQFQRTAKTDLGHVDLHGRDFDDIAMKIGKNAALNGVGGIAVTTVLTVVMQGGFRRASLKEVMNLLIKTGAAQSLRTVTSGALKVIAEKGAVPILTRTTPVIVIAALAGIAVESSKVVWQYEKGQIGILEAMDRIGRVSTSIIFAVGFGSVGGILGVAAFSVVPVAGPLIGGIIGSLIGELSGNLLGGKFGNFSYNSAKKIVNVVGNVIKEDIKLVENVNPVSLKKNKIKLKQKNLLFNKR